MPWNEAQRCRIAARMNAEEYGPRPASLPRAIRLTPPQIELLTDIATKPQMYLRRWSRWEKTGGVLVRLGLAGMADDGPDHWAITITQAGRDEAARRGLAGE